MGASQRRKGAVGEREASELIGRIFNTEASRNARNGVDRAEDIAHGVAGLFCEVKRVEALNVPKAMEKARIDADGRIPTLWHRRNRGEWLLTIRAEDIQVLVELYRAHQEVRK